MFFMLTACGKVLVAERLQEQLLQESARSFPQCLSEPVPAGSKRDLPLVKVSSSGSTSGMFKQEEKKNKTFTVASRREE